MRYFSFFVILSCLAWTSDTLAGCRRDSVYTYETDGFTKTLTNRTIYHYNSAGLTGETNQYLSFNQWINSSNITYTNNSAGIMGIRTVSSWTLNGWRNTSRESYTYNDRQKQSEVLLMAWDTLGNTWVNTQKLSYAYHSDGSDSLMLVQDWKNNQWVNLTRKETSVDSNGKTTGEIFYNWSINDTWTPAYKNIFRYESGLLAEFTWYWMQNKQWEYQKRYIYFYKGGVLAERLGQNRNQAAWVNSELQEHTYDASGCLSAITNYGNWNDRDSVWELIFKDSIFAVKTVGIREPEKSLYSIYPNPAADVFYFQAQSELDLSIIDHSGKTVLVKHLPEGEHAIDVSSLPPGLYSVTVPGFSDKMIIQR